MLADHQRRFLRRQGRRLGRVAQWTWEGRLLSELRQRRGSIRLRLRILLDLGLRALRREVSLRQRLGLPARLKPLEPHEIVLRTTDRPVVSVVIPAYGQVRHSLQCLTTLAAYPPALPFEVILAEDASGAQDAPRLRQVQGLRYIERPQNLGFLRSSNAAVAESRGEFIFLLNNDTEVMPGAIDALHGAMTRTHPAFPGPIGLTGARLLYPDGQLQEAGGILWRDGSAWNWGNRQDPRRPEFSYVREADYVSGAAIMVRRSAWEAMGGFDEHFLPAYCEDSDLALRLRDAGWRTLYVPEAMVMHHEGASHGTDTTQGVKAHQVANQQRLAVRHAATLSRHQENGTNLIRARDRAPRGSGRRVILVADNNILTPDQDAGSRTMMAFVTSMLTEGHVVKFWPLNGLHLPGYTEALQALGVECLTHPWTPPFEKWLAANADQLDEVFLSRPHVAEELLPALRRMAPRVPVVFYGHDLHHARIRREAQACAAEPARAARLEGEAQAMFQQELRVWEQVDLILYPTEDEAAEARRLAPGCPIRAITAYALPDQPVIPPSLEGRTDLVFVAGFAHSPNVDAAVHLVREVMPLIWEKCPAARLALVGSNPTPEVQALASDGVEVTGFVSDAELQRRYDAARVAICPLRFGAGIKLKVVEALHQGVPLVTTSVGAQGLPDVPCAVADAPVELAQAAVRLLLDDDAWRQMTVRQRQFVAGRFSAAAMRQSLEQAFSAAAERAAARSPA